MQIPEKHTVPNLAVNHDYAQSDYHGDTKWHKQTLSGSRIESCTLWEIKKKKKVLPSK